MTGSSPETFEVFSENTSGRFPMDVKKGYILFITFDSTPLQIDNCGNSGLLEENSKVVDLVKQLASEERKQQEHSQPVHVTPDRERDR